MTASIARMNLVLHGVEDSEIARGDTLAAPAFYEGDKLKTFDVVLAKTTIARHLLAPRIPGAKLVSIESIIAGDTSEDIIRGRQFAALQEYLQVAENVVVDIGASNVEDLLLLMSRYSGSHQDFDYFVIPTVPATKQQQDTIATLVALARLGVPADAARLVFNMLEETATLSANSNRCWLSSKSHRWPVRHWHAA